MRKISIILVFILLGTLVIPAYATQPATSAEEIRSAYIEFSEMVFDEGYSPTTSLQKFSEMFSEHPELSLLSFASLMAQNEVENMASLPVVPQYVSEFQDGLGTVEPNASVNLAWYDNLPRNSSGTPYLPQAASYSSFDFLDTVPDGAILFENYSGISEITGHVAIVEGVFLCPVRNQLYLRTIEANGAGVVYGVLDDTRYNVRRPTAFCVSNPPTGLITGAIGFCRTQIGKKYELGFPLTPCSYSSSNSGWYCSELIWAAFYNNGVNLYSGGIPIDIFMPATLVASSRLYSIAIT